MSEGRPSYPTTDDPNGYVVSVDWGNELFPIKTRADAIWYARAAMREGVESAQVWHRLDDGDEWSCAVDPNQECEYSAQRDQEQPDWLDR